MKRVLPVLELCKVRSIVRMDIKFLLAVVLRSTTHRIATASWYTLLCSFLGLFNRKCKHFSHGSNTKPNLNGHKPRVNFCTFGNGTLSLQSANRNQLIAQASSTSTLTSTAHMGHRLRIPNPNTSSPRSPGAEERLLVARPAGPGSAII